MRRLPRLFSRPSPAERFNATVSALRESGGAAVDERLMGASYLAFMPDQLLTNNAGFLRRQAHLTVVYLTDESDQTPVMSPVPGGDPVLHRDNLTSLKGYDGAADVSVISIFPVAVLPDAGAEVVIEYRPHLRRDSVSPPLAGPFAGYAAAVESSRRSFRARRAAPASLR